MWLKFFIFKSYIYIIYDVYKICRLNFYFLEFILWIYSKVKLYVYVSYISFNIYIYYIKRRKIKVGVELEIKG